MLKRSILHATSGRFFPADRVIWMAASALAVFFALRSLTPDGHFHTYFLTGLDSFYHGTRILEFLQTGQFSEFDTRSYVPDGTWINWPWVYDYLLAWLARLGQPVIDPVTLLVLVPVAAAVLSLLLTLWLCRLLGLQWPGVLLVLAGMAIMPSFQHLHLAGRIDHHFLQLIFTLATMTSLCQWAARPADVRPALICGVTLGLAHMASNGEFILQLLPLGYAAIAWTRSPRFSIDSVNFFCGGLLVSLLLLLAGSVPFHQLSFDFALLSWFHLYVACLTAVAMQLLARLAPSLRCAIVILTSCLVLIAPAIAIISRGIGFVAAAAFAPLESESVFSMHEAALVLYTPLIVLSVPALVFCVWRNRLRPGARLAFCVSALLCGMLFMLQVRFNYYGLIVIIPPIALAIQDLCRGRAAWMPVSASLLLLAVSFLVTRPALQENPIRQWNPEYFDNLAVYDTLDQLCQIEPGIVLAHPNQGQYLLFHSQCQVMSTNHAAWPFQYAARHRTLEMLSLTPAELVHKHPEVRYVLLNRYDGTRLQERPAAARLNASGLNAILMAEEVAGSAESFILAAEVLAQREDSIYPLTRLYLIEPETKP